MPLPSGGLTEIRSAQPATDYHWVSGHYRWEVAAKAYVWVRGGWEKVVPNHRWLKGRYRTIAYDAVKVQEWTPGRWVERRRSAAPQMENTPREVDSDRARRPRADTD